MNKCISINLFIRFASREGNIPCVLNSLCIDLHITYMNHKKCCFFFLRILFYTLIFPTPHFYTHFTKFDWLKEKFYIWIKHGFSCINIRQVPWEVLKTEAEGRGFQRFPRDLANVNALKNHVRSLLLHKN